MAEIDPSQRIVITGMGTAAPTPNGFSVEGFWQDLIYNRHAIQDLTPIIEGYTDDIESRLGAPLPPFNIKEILENNGFNVKEPNIYKEARRWHRSAQAVVWAGAQALRQAKLLDANSLRIDAKQVNPRKFGVYQGTGIGGALNLVEIQKLLDRRRDGDKSQKLADFAYSMLHLLPGRVDEVPAILFNAKAVNETFQTECAAGLSSIERAADDLRQGRTEVMLAGGVETAAHPAPIWAFETLGALTKERNPSAAPKPFSLHPGGLVLGEGAAEVVLEPLDRVLWRQKKFGSKVLVLGEFLGAGRSSDAEQDTFPSDEGACWAIDEALADAGYEPEELKDLMIQAHATATDGDIKEFRSIARRFKPDQLVGISSIKGHTGHTFGAAGALSFITGVLNMRYNTVTANRNLYEPHPEMAGWPMVPHHARQVEKVGMVMINAFGFGGKNRVAILGPGEKQPT